MVVSEHELGTTTVLSVRVSQCTNNKIIHHQFLPEHYDNSYSCYRNDKFKYCPNWSPDLKLSERKEIFIQLSKKIMHDYVTCSMMFFQSNTKNWRQSNEQQLQPFSSLFLFVPRSESCLVRVILAHRLSLGDPGLLSVK